MGLRVISWIESLHTAGDALNHTKNHEKQNCLSYIELANIPANCRVILKHYIRSVQMSFEARMAMPLLRLHHQEIVAAEILCYELVIHNECWVDSC